MKDDMNISEGFLIEFDMEMASTRKILERLPENKNDWRPHAKSMTMWEIALHVARLPAWIPSMMTEDSYDITSPAASQVELPAAQTREALLAYFDKNVPLARAAIAAATDANMHETWSLLAHGKSVVRPLPRVGALRFFVFNHLIHHRAQLGLYLRMNDIPLPGIYGPTADEGHM
jgi:uncharacterized damage-inducible protein DinB